MNITKAHLYKLVDYPDRRLIIFEEDTGWLYISGRVGAFYGKDNIFPSIEMIESVINQKLEHMKTIEVDEDECERNAAGRQEG